ncbi:alpha- and gamma-adaptin-binding protein p34-like [Amphibalanus amphitrite]|uniref:alpha- and gamma-adaptin-binding protein p34-like n=1 Tax=Amphibalanus amphitrite TaxID=1232801 RepID=UPI001C90D0AB|nr:alpha- and gamma-adaptin-binding protein p34-like [Amphibalanus amphitrite]XP_043226321.1 alpha- and gamma-adaptin-binding protein p34-like [Amphibalanus amphitrite]XP_043226322.1 alpha- and gamma-adaptin-binding protein p34-like [Amphibalanus amphitrite]XP_043226323.1 alpha- and gamma-adaptin-binding protein p34-like [Amphibalanus amphitrite]
MVEPKMVSDSEPCVFIYGPEATIVNRIIHYMAGAGAERQAVSDMAVCYPWHVDNKYYTADVRLCHVQRKGLPDQALADRCEAVIIYFNSDEANGLDEVDSILTFTKEFEPDVCMLVCETCSENTPVSRLRAQEWCVSHGFELVELSPADEADPDDDFPETTGVQRIVQALHAHTWSNLEMKDHQPPVSNKLVNDVTAERVPDNATQGSGGGGDAETTPASQTAAEDAATAASVDTLVTELAGLMGSGGGGGDPSEPGGADDFELLFSQLSELRAAAARAPPHQRHEMAERVAMAFLRSMGGDEDGEDSD